jgi:hypothetical protein
MSTRGIAIATLAVAGATAAALAVAARLEGMRAVQPLNATSHWLYGAAAAKSREISARHTAVGLATHVASSAFWAGLYGWLRGSGRPRPALIDAAGLTVTAAVADYVVAPARVTPGWELVVSRRSIAFAYAAMVAALVWTTPGIDGRARR